MAFTINNGWHAESGGMEEAVSFSGFSATTVQKHTGLYSFTGAAGDNAVFDPFEVVASAGTGTIVGFWYRTQSTFTTNEIIRLWDGTNTDFSIQQISDGTIELQDSTFTTRITSSALSTSTWYFFEAYIDRVDSGSAQLFIDGVSAGTTAARDFNAITGTTQLRLSGGANSPYFDDIYFGSGATAASDRLGGCELIPYGNATTTATSDAGDNLEGGTVWTDCNDVPFAAGTAATFQGTGFGGSVDTDGVGGSAGTGGPLTDANITGTLPFVKAMWNIKRGNGGATSHFGWYGNSGDGTTPTADLALTTAYEMRFAVSEAATIVPTASEYGRIGFRTDNVQNIICADQLLVVLHVPSAGPSPLETVAGSYVITGQPVAATVQRKISAAAGSYAITGQPVALIRGKTLPAAAGSYAISGQPVALTVNRTLDSVTGSYVISGQPALLAHQHRFLAAAGSYAITGQPVDFLLSKTLQTVTGAYTITGQPIGLTTQRQINTAVGSYAVTGVNAALEHSYQLKVNSGSYVISGVAAALDWSAYLATVPGTYNITGQPVDFLLSKTIQIDTGSYAVTGVAVNFIHNFSIPVITGSYVISGLPPALQSGGKISADPGVYNLSGQPAALARVYILVCDSGSVTYTGLAVDLDHNYTLVVDGGSYSISGISAKLPINFLLGCTEGAYAISGVNAALNTNPTLSSQSGVYVITGLAAALNPSTLGDRRIMVVT